MWYRKSERRFIIHFFFCFQEQISIEQWLLVLVFSIQIYYILVCTLISFLQNVCWMKEKRETKRLKSEIYAHWVDEYYK